MVSDPNFEIVPQPIRIDEYVTTRLSPDAISFESAYGPGGLGAHITRDTRCFRCNQPFASGERLVAHLREDFAAAPVEHDGPCPPAPEFAFEPLVPPDTDVVKWASA